MYVWGLETSFCGKNPAGTLRALYLDFTGWSLWLACLTDGTSRPIKDIPMLIEMFRQGRLRLDALVAHHFRLTDINNAIAKMDSGHGARGIVTFHN